MNEYKITLTIWYNGEENEADNMIRSIRKISGVTSILLLARSELPRRDNIKKFEYPDLARGL